MWCRTGALAGTTIRDLIASRRQELLGSALGPRDQFPLLVKFIDAHQHLSVQVHPNDEIGRKLVNDNGKTETWVILDAEPGSLIYCRAQAGRRPLTSSALRSARARSNISCIMFEPRAGDCILIEAGTVHAIGAGVLLAEIQEMSDATFRVYDWGRVGAERQAAPASYPAGSGIDRLRSRPGRTDRTGRGANRRRRHARATVAIAILRPRTSQVGPACVRGRLMTGLRL